MGKRRGVSTKRASRLGGATVKKHASTGRFLSQKKQEAAAAFVADRASASGDAPAVIQQKGAPEMVVLSQQEYRELQQQAGREIEPSYVLVSSEVYQRLRRSQGDRPASTGDSDSTVDAGASSGQRLVDRLNMHDDRDLVFGKLDLGLRVPEL